MKEIQLVCTKCKKTFSADRVHPRCDVCGEPLELERITHGKVNSHNGINQTIFERYADFLPFSEGDKLISLHEGFTPLVESPKLAYELDINKIYFKNESQNPTWSFKDRGTAVGVNHAINLGYKRIGTVSTGNMAVSVAAYGARAGVETYILVNSGMPSEKLNPIAVYNSHLIKVEGDYGNLYYESLEIGRQNDIYFINSDVPFRVEGSKTIAFEICEQLDFKIPDHVIVPTSAGGNIRGILKGFEEFKECGLIDRVPGIICAQASGCSPICNAFISNESCISRVKNPHTIAHAIENPFPPSGNEVLRIVREKVGTCAAVTDEEIIEAQKQLAKEGIFGQPAAAVPLAAVNKLRKDGYLSKDSTVACIVTGSGLKYTSVIESFNLRNIYSCNLGDLSKMIKNLI